MLAVLKAGGAFAFLDPTHGSERLKVTTKTINVRVLLTTSTHLALFDGLDGELIVIDTALMESLHNQSPGLQTYRNDNVQPHHTSYIIWTSGTTGVGRNLSLVKISESVSCCKPTLSESSNKS